MREYFVSVIVVALVGGMMISMLPDESGTRHLRLLCSLCTIACMVAPVAAFFDGGFDDEHVLDMFDTEFETDNIYDEIYNNSLNDHSRINAEISLKNDIIQHFSAPNDAFDVKIVLQENNVVNCISSVEIRIYSSGLAIDPREVEKYVFDKLGCDCSIIYDIL